MLDVIEDVTFCWTGLFIEMNVFRPLCRTKSGRRTVEKEDNIYNHF